MNSLLDETDDREDHASRGGDREITLGTTMILLIFFALAVYGAALFGFGYSLGSKHSTGTSMAAAPISSASFNAFKPAPGSPAGSVPANKASAADFVDSPPAPTSVKVDLPAAKAAPEPEPDDAALKAKPASLAPPPASSATAPVAPPTPIPVATASGTVVVQVAAVSHQEDAELIATTLKRRGYVVNIRNESDKLFHVQVGPFATRKDADTMKAKLLADGFNAYIK